MGGNGFQNCSTIPHVLCQRPNLVQRRTIGNQSVAGHRTVSGFHPHHTAVGRGLSDGAAGIGAQSIEALPCCHRRRRTTGRPSRHMVRVTGISGDAVGGSLRGGTHGKLIHIRLTQNHGAGFLQVQDRLRRIGGYEVVQNPGCTGGEKPFCT